MCLLSGRTLVPGPGSPGTFPSPRRQELPWCLPSVLPHMPLLAPTWWGEEGAHEGFRRQWESLAGSWGLGPSRLGTVVRQIRMPQPLPD